MSEKYPDDIDTAHDLIERLRADLDKPWTALDEVARLPEAEKKRRRDAAVEAIRNKIDLACANERLEDALALLGEWQSLPVRDYWRDDLAVRTRKFMEADG